uniref:SUEL-type lectin domain-containing protein n=1 Tax=Cyprinus carpio TaxID=7962 RepID=A0A8C1X0G1_CYPCA
SGVYCSLPYKTVITCDGFVQRLSCDTGVISVQSATCGRTSSQICSVGRPPSETSNTQCSIDVPLVELNGAVRNAVAEPCFREYKHTTNGKMFSDDGTVIRIHSANYGRTDSTTCSTGRPASQLAKTDCYALNSQTVVTSGSVYVCEGKNSCSILASNSVFSDPCVGTFKYLYISYFCVLKCKCDCTEQ